MIEVRSETLIRTSRELVWRHLTRIPDWYRWYPGLHGVDIAESVHGIGTKWRATGQLGRLFYRSVSQVSDYQTLQAMEITGSRRPWIRWTRLRFHLEPDGPNARLSVAITAIPGFGPPGRLLLTGLLRRRSQTEADEIVARFRSYVERTMPYH